MMAVGFVLLFLGIGRVTADVHMNYPLADKDKWKWGMLIIAGFVLVAASITQFLWNHMP